MTATLVDSDVILDVATDDASWSARSAAALGRAADSGPLVVNPIVYAEVSIGFATIEALQVALPPDVFVREDLPWTAAFLAGKAFLGYRRKGGAPRSPLPDFYIGAHAAVSGHKLLTRDARRYRTSFPTVELVTP
ncbi:MAG: type II toxin-antitoxin system VapC family toxin [Acidimicrobiia bacterium]|nr:type II toxin-antitoxin system VapC family toxin [Acidimicrobiia bacterium]